MVEETLPTQPIIITETAWNRLIPKQKKIVAFMVSKLEEWLEIRQIKEGTGLSSLHGRDLTSLNAKLVGLNSRLQISCRKEEESNRITWKLEKK